MKNFCNVNDRFYDESECEDVSLILIQNCQKNDWIYNQPTSFELAILIVGDFQLNIYKKIF